MIVMELKIFVGNGDYTTMSKLIRVVENGQAKESTSVSVNKIKLDRNLDSNKVDEIINRKEKDK